jgi:hypothetical protein
MSPARALAVVLLLAAATASAAPPPARFPVPDVKKQFIAFNANYTAEAAALTAARRAAFARFEALAAAHPSAETACALQRLTECKLQIVTAANFSLGWTIMGEIDLLLAAPPSAWPGDRQSPVDGGWGTCYHGFYLRVEATYDAILALAGHGLAPPLPVTFFDPINSAPALLACLRALTNIDIARSGRDTVIAANTVNSNVLRLLHKQLPTTYKWQPGLGAALRNFTFAEWRGAASGAWGPTYAVAGGGSLCVPDLSTTFHITKYYTEYGVDVGRWPALAQTTVDLVGVPFPWGQFTREGIPFNHNLYDTATLFRHAWPAAPAVRPAMAAQAAEWLNFTLATLGADGAWARTAYDDSYETAQYFGTGVLQQLGFFNTTCFWAAANATRCHGGRSGKARSTAYDSIAANLFGKLAASHGKGGDYTSALAKLGLDIPEQLQR